MQYAQFGATDLQRIAISLGTASLGELFGPVADKDGPRVVHEALDGGINFFDTSPYYGSAEGFRKRSSRKTRPSLCCHQGRTLRAR